MKRIDCIWVLALAGTVMACNSGSPLEGCEINLVTGLCVGRNVPGPGPGPGPGTGGTGGVPEGVFTNANACTNNVEPDCTAPDTCDCDYGCVANAVTFGFAAILNVIPDEAFVGGDEFDVEFDGQFQVSEAFIAGAEDNLGVDIKEITVLEGAVLPVTALSGATGPDTIVTLPGGLVLDVELDPDGNGIFGPFPIPFVRTTGTYTFEASGGTACFNLSTGTQTPPATDLKFILDISNPPLFKVPFVCQPANQEAINQTNVPCPTGGSDCDFGGCDGAPVDPSCFGVLIPEAEAGQVCFDIP